MDPIAWVQNIHDHPPERPGEALAAMLSALASLCDEATPIMPKNITPEFFDTLREDPEFDDIAAEVLSVVRSYTAQEFPRGERKLEPSSPTQRFREMSFIGAGFEHAMEATGMDWQLAKEVAQAMNENFALLKLSWAKVDAIADALNSPLAYVIALVCGLAIFYGASYEVITKGPIEGPKAVIRKPIFVPMVIGALWFSTNHWTRVATVCQSPSNPAKWWTPIKNDWERSLGANNRHRLLNPNVDEMKEILEWFNETIGENNRKAYDNLGVSGDKMLVQWYTQNKQAPPPYLDYPFRRAVRGASDALTNLGGTLLSNPKDQGERDWDRLLDFLNIAIADHRNGNDRYTYNKHWRRFLTIGFIAAEAAAIYYEQRKRQIVDVYGGVTPVNDLHGRLLKQLQILKSIGRPYWKYAGAGPHNLQDDINDAGRIITELAARSAFEVMDAGELEDSMTILIDTRKAADRHTGHGAQPERGDLTAYETNQVLNIRNRAWSARDHWDRDRNRDHPDLPFINAPFAGGNSSVVDHVFAMAGL